jgi:hypothetical protein
VAGCRSHDWQFAPSAWTIGFAVRLRRRKLNECGFRSNRALELNKLARIAARWAVDHRAALVGTSGVREMERRAQQLERLLGRLHA